MKAPEISRPLEARRSGPLKGVALVPGDKSISHRALILGALAVGETKISGLLEADDVLCTAAAMRKLGVTVLHDRYGSVGVHGQELGRIVAAEFVADVVALVGESQLADTPHYRLHVG